MDRGDGELVEAYLAGEHAAFDALVARHLKPIRYFILRLTQDEEVANDLAQETFIKVWRALRRFDTTQRFTTWLYTIARRTVIDWSRKRRPVLFSALRDTDEDQIEMQVPDTEPLPDAVFAQAALHELVTAALDELAPRYREVLILHYLQGLSFAEISAATGTPVHTAKSQARRGGMYLRAVLLEKMHQTGDDLRI